MNAINICMKAILKCLKVTKKKNNFLKEKSSYKTFYLMKISYFDHVKVFFFLQNQINKSYFHVISLMIVTMNTYQDKSAITVVFTYLR